MVQTMKSLIHRVLCMMDYLRSGGMDIKMSYFMPVAL